MRRQNYVMFVALIGVCAGGGWSYGQGGGEPVSQRLPGADVAEIEQLYARYNQGWDFKDVELYLSAYTEDAVFTTGTGTAYVGKAAIRDYLTTAFSNGVSADRTHNNTSILLTSTADGAVGRGYWTVVNVMAQPPAIAGVGYYDDTFVKTENGWRIKSRTSTRGWAWRVSQ